MNRKVSVLLVASLLIFSIELPAKAKKRGAELVVTKNDGQVLKGELIAVKQNSVLLLSAEGADVSVDIKNIDIISIEKKSKVAKGAGIGFLVGAGIGALIAVAASAATEGEGLVYDDLALSVLLSGGFFGALGLLVGTIFGATSSPYKEIKIKGKSDPEINKILEKLRRQARVSNAL